MDVLVQLDDPDASTRARSRAGVAALQGEVGRVLAGILTGLVHHLPEHAGDAVPRIRFVRSVALLMLAVGIAAIGGAATLAEWRSTVSLLAGGSGRESRE